MSFSCLRGEQSKWCKLDLLHTMVMQDSPKPIGEITEENLNQEPIGNRCNYDPRVRGDPYETKIRAETCCGARIACSIVNF
eukprot:4522872-Karenia_brevis.AAC.1